MNNRLDNHVGGNRLSEDYRSLLVLDEISKNNELTQFELSKKLGMAVGLINSYIKNLISKGYITVTAIPKRRYSYYLTPKGFVEKTRLTYRHLHNFTNLYRVARRDFHSLFLDLERRKIKSVAFCGVGEVAEIAYLSLNETGLRLAGVIDDANVGGKTFFGQEVLPLEGVITLDCDLVVITSFHGGGMVLKRLELLGVSHDRVCDISSGGWIKRLAELESAALSD